VFGAGDGAARPRAHRGRPRLMTFQP
jgi:hypothetical protein